MAETPDNKGFLVYDEFIVEQLAAEEARKTSIEARAVAVITTSGAIVALMFGLTGIVTGRSGYVPPASAGHRLSLALWFFGFAVVLGLVVNLPLSYKNVLPAELQMAVEDLWNENEATARQRTSATRVKMLYRAQLLNQIKGYVLLAGFGFEVAGVLSLASAAITILHDGFH